MDVNTQTRGINEKKTILIVDDSQLNRKILGKLLVNDFNIEEAENGSAALSILNEKYNDIAVVLLDIIMPVMNGYELLNNMRNDEKLFPVPVIIISAADETQNSLKAIELGASDFVSKPVDPVLLRLRINSAISKHENDILRAKYEYLQIERAKENEYQERLRYAAAHDELTGIYSKTAFIEECEKLISTLKCKYAIITFDIERFKVINDVFGHAEGDRLLCMIAECVQNYVNTCGGICCRLNADNYAVCVPYNNTTVSQIKDVLNKAVNEYSLRFDVVFHYGVYEESGEELSVYAMLDRASLAKLTTKGNYVNRVAVFDNKLRDSLLAEQEIINEMNAAIESGQFHIYLQPQYNHSNGVLVGAEALVRWIHPVKGIMPPALFIPVFERNGFIIELDKYVWELSCRLIKDWLQRGITPVPISVNISRLDIYHVDLAETLIGLIEKYGLEPSMLRLEITESAYVDNAYRLISVVKKLQNYGFTVEMDDFGSGYSSLNTLKDVPVDVLKLDMRFLSDNSGSGRGGNILTSVVRMAKWIEIPIIAEGVETVEQADFLCSIGCYIIQGYYYAKPLPVNEFEALLARRGQISEKTETRLYHAVDPNEFWSPESYTTMLFNNFVGAAFVTEYNGVTAEVLRVNSGFIECMGIDYSLYEAKKTNILQALHGGDVKIFTQMLEDAWKGNGKAECEARFEWKCGEIKYIRTIVRILSKGKQRCICYALAEDITAQKNAEAELKKLKDPVL